MISLKQINQNIEAGVSLQDLTQIFTELAVVKLNRIRSEIERNIQFGNEIINLFTFIKSEANKKKINIAYPKKNLSILLSSNERFFGSLENQVFDMISKDILKNDSDIVVIGKTGDEFLKNLSPDNKYQTFIFVQDIPLPNELRILTSYAQIYQNIYVYHAKFKSVLSQTPVTTKFEKAAELKVSEQKEKSGLFKEVVIFEPELYKILSFFEVQLLELFLEQTFLESELARTASRVISMDIAQDNAISFLKSQNKLLNILKNFSENTKVLEQSANINFWKKRGYER